MCSKGASRSWAIHNLLVRIFWVCYSFRIRYDIVWLPRELNQLSDDLSKADDVDDWTLKVQFWNLVCLRFGPFDCDRFASDSTALLPRFNAMFWSADCWFVDCFARSWSGYSNWCHPNPRDAGRVLETVRKERVKAALLVPEWCGAVWWRQLCPDGRHLGPWVIDWLVLPKYCFNRGQGSH